MTHKGFYDATTDEEQIIGWFNKWPEANIGIRTGKESNIVVLDVDLKNNGDQHLGELEKAYGPLPSTIEVISGSGGSHYYFNYPKSEFDARKEIAAGVEIKADGGYIIAPPSLHACGNQYRWKDGHEPWFMELAPLPEWLLQLANKKTKEPRNTSLAVANRQLPMRRGVGSLESVPNLNSPSLPLKQLVAQALDRTAQGQGRNNVGFDLACQMFLSIRNGPLRWTGMAHPGTMARS